MFASDEKKQAAEIARQKNEGVTGRYQRRYNFTLKQQHWIAPGILTKHQITGQFDCGLVNISGGVQTWSIEQRNLQFDWNPNALPEVYAIFSYPSRMDIQIDNQGKIVGGDTHVNFHKRWHTLYKDTCISHLSDANERKENLLQTFSGRENNLPLALGLLEVNPWVGALCNIVKLNAQIAQANEPPGMFGERFTGEIVKKNYFSEHIHLPLKTTWLQRDIADENMQEWSHVGGLVKEKYQEYELRKMLRMITGSQQLDTDIDVTFAELYRLERMSADLLQIGYCLLQTETLIKDTWVKSEELEMETEENGIIYGTE